MKINIWKGDVLDGLAAMAADSVDCCVTSPPYWGLRDYGVEGQIGLEPTLQEHLDKMVEVFEGIKRVLKPSGTVWLNYGDCYASTVNGRKAEDITNDDRAFRDKPFSTVQGNLKPKDLCMIPNRLAIALQEAGWWVRSEIIWAKPNPMPESAKDRPAGAHEKIFLLTKSPRYFYNHEDSRIQRKTLSDGKLPDGWDTGPGAHGSVHRNGREKGKKIDKTRGHEREHSGFKKKYDQMTKAEQQENGRSLRNWEPAPVQVWEIATKPFKDAHFATFPPELVERCLRAGCPVGGLVLDPFGGSGTTGMVADQMGMNAHLIELNDNYVNIAYKRISNSAGMFQDIAVGDKNNQNEMFLGIDLGRAI